MTTTLPKTIELARLGLALAASCVLGCSSSSDLRRIEEQPLESGNLQPAGFQWESGVSLLSAAQRTVHVPPPLELTGSVFEAAATVALPEVPPGQYPGIVNVYRLSDTIITGSEPHDAEALGQLAAWGVKTVLSVDGKVPDVEAATALGLRYVHVPIRYRGITDDQILKIAKTFRELEGPFYVHCFHGKHRGPAAAAIGRVALDGLERDHAIAEMRQWCSTASKYEGLYSSVALSALPTADETAAYEFDFASAMSFEGVRDAMVVLTRSWDEVKLVARNGWKPSSEHPDIDALQSATHVSELMNACGQMEESKAYAADFHEMLAESQGHLGDVVEFLTAGRVEGTSEFLASDGLDAAFNAAKKSCLTCHAVYRN
jgi:protein tyrosine phosphatase (PTP) superfamily phosphohydrolase (DUF442 family)